MRTALEVAVIAAAVLAAGCATGEEWATWKDHPTHFASGEHMTFSMRNHTRAPRVERRDVVAARNEGWWGKPITVAQEQIIER